MQIDRTAFFHRRALADLLAQKLLRPSCLDTTLRDGLFITGNRRVGKTTFINQDLIPALRAMNAVVIYIDLWASGEKRSFEERILAVLRKTFSDLSSGGPILKELKLTIPFVSLSFGPDDIGATGGVSLADAFLELIERIDRSVVLIIDEVQDALKSEHGLEFLKSLKAARDAVKVRANNPNETYLLIVGTGSHRSMVSAMASKPSQPFYGSDRMDFPLLGEDFVDWAIETFKLDGPPSRNALCLGFRHLGCKPKVFLQLVKGVNLEGVADPDSAFLGASSNQARHEADAMIGQLLDEDPLTRRLFTAIARTGPAGLGNLFSADFRRSLSDAIDPAAPPSASTIQGKLKALERLDLIYSVSYGRYAVTDDQAAKVWLANLEDYTSTYE